MSEKYANQNIWWAAKRTPLLLTVVCVGYFWMIEIINKDIGLHLLVMTILIGLPILLTGYLAMYAVGLPIIFFLKKMSLLNLLSLFMTANSVSLLLTWLAADYDIPVDSILSVGCIFGTIAGIIFYVLLVRFSKRKNINQCRLQQ